MATDYRTIDETPPRGRAWLRWLIPFVLVFAAGAAAMGYVLTHWPVAARYIAGKPAETLVIQPVPAQPMMAVPSGVVAPASLDTAQQAALDRRVAELEGRIAQIGARANAAVGNADRAEGLLVAFAARRALDRGVALGYIEALLRDRFGTSQPQAVATIIGAGRQPVTIEELQAGLTDIGPTLTGGGPDEGWLEGLRRELSGLVVVRRASIPSPDPADRLARAKREIEAGHVGAALAEVARMPGRDKAAGWIATARRYTGARDALDVIETAALLEPRAAPPPAAVPALAPASTDFAPQADEGISHEDSAARHRPDRRLRRGRRGAAPLLQPAPAPARQAAAGGGAAWCDRRLRRAMRADRSAALSWRLQEYVPVGGALHARRRLCALRRPGRNGAGARLRRGGQAEAARLRPAAGAKPAACRRRAALDLARIRRQVQSDRLTPIGRDERCG